MWRRLWRRRLRQAVCTIFACDLGRIFICSGIVGCVQAMLDSAVGIAEDFRSDLNVGSPERYQLIVDIIRRLCGTTERSIVRCSSRQLAVMKRFP